MRSLAAWISAKEAGWCISVGQPRPSFSDEVMVEHHTFACSNFGTVREQLLELASAWTGAKLLVSTLLLLQTTDGERPNFRDPVKIAIDMNHAQTVVEGGLGDQEVGDRGPMPHPVVMREVVLKAKRSVQ